jgi:hypothetical protein
LLSSGVDTLFHWKSLDYDDHIDFWYLHPIRIVVIIGGTFLICIVDRSSLPNEYEKVLYIILYNLMQIVLNDLSFTLFNILFRSKVLKEYGPKDDLYKSIFFGGYTICFLLFIEPLVRYLMVKKFQMDTSCEQIFIFLFTFYKSYAKSMFIYTDAHITHWSQYIVYTIIFILDIVLLYVTLNNYWNRMWKRIKSHSSSIERWAAQRIPNSLLRRGKPLVHKVTPVIDGVLPEQNTPAFYEHELANRNSLADSISQTRLGKEKFIPLNIIDIKVVVGEEQASELSPSEIERFLTDRFVDHFASYVSFGTSTICFFWACACQWFHIIPTFTLHHDNTKLDKLKICAIYFTLEIVRFLVSFIIICRKKYNWKKPMKNVWNILRIYNSYIITITLSYVTHTLRFWL